MERPSSTESMLSDIPVFPRPGKRSHAISLPSIEQVEIEVIEIRSEINHALLGTVGKEGIYFWERRAKSRNVLTWAEILKCCQEQCEQVTALLQSLET